MATQATEDEVRCRTAQADYSNKLLQHRELESRNRKVFQHRELESRSRKEVSKEVILKNEALRQRESIQSILQTKSSELVRTTGECSKLREMNTTLVKELVALKFSVHLLTSCVDSFSYLDF